MIFILSLFILAVIIFLFMVASETYAMRNPKSKYTIWWRNNIIEQNEDYY